MLGLEQNVFQPDRRTMIRQPAAHDAALRFRELRPPVLPVRLSCLSASALGKCTTRRAQSAPVGHPHRPGRIDHVVLRLVHHQEHDRVIGGEDRREAHEEAGEHLPPRLQDRKRSAQQREEETAGRVRSGREFRCGSARSCSLLTIRSASYRSMSGLSRRSKSPVASAKAVSTSRPAADPLQVGGDAI